MSSHTATLSDALEVLEAIAAACDSNEVESCYAMANEHWANDGLHRDDILDAAQFLRSAFLCRMAGQIDRALRNEASLDRILASYSL